MTWSKSRSERLAERVQFGDRLIAIGRPHGTYSTYANWSCQCDPCIAAMRAYNANRKDRPPNITKHRSNATDYNAGCRCEVCTDAHRVRTARIKKRRYAQRVEIDGRLVAVGRTHGSPSTYKNWGCRCEPCTKVHSAACTDYAQRRKTWR